jgi:hypothetical protein
MTRDSQTGPLDAAFQAWSEAVSPRIDPELRTAAREKPWFRNPRIRISLNDQAVTFRGGDERADPHLLDAPETDLLVRDLRAAMRPSVWPLTLIIELEGLERKNSWRVTPQLIGAEMAGLELSEKTGALLQRDGYRGLRGLDRITEAGELLARLTPPSNGPIRGWSRVSDMMGSAHVHYQGVHARSEAEALLKLILVQEGLDRLTEMARAGRIEMRDGPFRTWFTATNLEDLDLDPEGRPVSREAALGQLNDHISGLNTLDPEL